MASVGARAAQAASSIATAPAPSANDPRVASLLVGSRWAVATISYSDPDRSGDYGAAYSADQDGDGIPASREGFSPLTAAQLQAVHAVLNADAFTQPAAHAVFSVEGLTRLDITYAGPGSGAGTLRFANTRDVPAPANTAYAFFPDARDTGGDVWFEGAGRLPVAGNHDYLTALHETGHALGLKHGHETPHALPAADDSLEFTVMTYRSHVGAKADFYRNGPVDYPQTYMMLDIAALQHLYGADFTTNAGNTTYSWSPATGATLVNGAVAIAPAGNRIFLTLWDGGGTDTYDLSGYASNLSIDLRPGRGSTFAAGQLADLGGGPNGGHARANLFNALLYQGDSRSLIENARGGSGSDMLTGNDVANQLEGNRGNDRLAGLGGADLLLGGKGDDVLNGGRGADILTGAAGGDRFAFSARLDSPSEAACDVIRDFAAPGATAGDLVDLSGIDARDGKAGNQAFVFGGTGPGHLRLIDKEAATLVCADTGGSTAFDFVLRIADGTSAADDYTTQDFIL